MYIMSEEEKAYLSNYNWEKYDRPSVATDIVVFMVGRVESEDIRHLPEKKLRVLLIKRGSHPYKDAWALPGGFCRRKEEVHETARRELFEETGIKDAYLNLSGIYGDVDRDPRGWIISHGFLALIDGEKCILRADSDARDAKWFDVYVKDVCQEKTSQGEMVEITNIYELKFVCDGEELSGKVCEKKLYKNYHEQSSYEILECNGLAFDHVRIILDAYKKMQNAAIHDDKIIFDLMPEKFTLTELQNVFELVLGRELLKANFRRKIADLVLETDDMESGKGYRAAKQFVRNVEKFYES